MPIRVGICGLGERAGHIAGFFCTNDKRFRLVAYADPEPRGLAFLKSRDIVPSRAYDDIGRMLDKERLDLLIIGSPNHLHLEHIRRGLEAGIRVFTEKPVVISEEETWELLDLLREHSHTNLMVGLVLRYAPLYRDLIRIVRSGRLGRVISGEASEHLSPDHGAFLMRNWRRYEKYTGGYMLEKCCHDIDIYQSVIGSRPARVASFGSRRIFTPQHRHLEDNPLYREWPSGWKGTSSSFVSDADIVDNQTVLIEYEDGVNLCFHSNTHTASRFRRFCFIGTDGMIEGDFERNYLRAHDSQTGNVSFESSYEFDGHGHYGSEELMARDIAAHIVDGASLPVSIFDAIETGLIAMKIDEARKTGAVLSLEAMWSLYDRRSKSISRLDDTG